MAKTAWINRNERKRATVKKYAAQRGPILGSQIYQRARQTKTAGRCSGMIARFVSLQIVRLAL